MFQLIGTAILHVGTLSCHVNDNSNKAIVDYTSPALCTPITPFPADPICSDAAVSSAPAWCYLLRSRYTALSIGPSPLSRW